MFPLTIEPKVLAVKGEVIRDAVREYIANGEATIKSYEGAVGVQLKGKYTWTDHIGSVRRELRAMQTIVENIGDGPHLMSVADFKALWNHFSAWKTADEVIAESSRNGSGEDS